MTTSLAGPLDQLVRRRRRASSDGVADPPIARGIRHDRTDDRERPVASIVETISMIDPAEWAAIVPDDPLWAWSFLRAMEAGSIGPDAHDYIVVRQGGRLVAVMPTSTFRHLPLTDVVGHEARRILAPVYRIVPRLLQLRVLFVGHLLCDGRLCALDRTDHDVADLIVSSVRDLASRRKCRWTVFKDFEPAELEPLRSSLDRLGYFDVPALDDTALDLSWPDFPSYVASLPAKPRRNLRNKQRRLERSGCSIDVTDDFAPLVPEMVLLYQQVLDRAESRLDTWNGGFLEALAGAVEIDCAVVTCRRDERLVGFLLCVFGTHNAVALRVGLDYAGATDAAVYHNLHYRGIALAIERGYHTLGFSQTAYEPKREMGCRQIPLVHAVTHVNPVSRAILVRLLPWALASAEPADRRAGPSPPSPPEQPDRTPR